MILSQMDGDEASNKVNSDPDRFDLIFMDIIMPKFDGVSATVYIRGLNTRVPIIAMTSNIRQEEIASYYHWGKHSPFTLVCVDSERIEADLEVQE